MFWIAKYYRVPNYFKLFKCHCFSGSGKKDLAKWCDASIKAVRNASLSRRVVSTSWRAIPLNKPDTNFSYPFMWQNHTKILGPGALIFVARQLWPKSARTGSSSSEASIKATLFQNRIDNTHTKVSPEITTQIISYISEFAAESKFIPKPCSK